MLPMNWSLGLDRLKGALGTGWDWAGQNMGWSGILGSPEDIRRKIAKQKEMERVAGIPYRDEIAGLPVTKRMLGDPRGSEYTGGYDKYLRDKLSADKSEESDFDKYMKMQFLSKLIERQKAPSAGYPTRAGTARQPVATSLMQTYPQRRQDDLLNFRYGRSYGGMA